MLIRALDRNCHGEPRTNLVRPRRAGRLTVRRCRMGTCISMTPQISKARASWPKFSGGAPQLAAQRVIASAQSRQSLRSDARPFPKGGRLGQGSEEEQSRNPQAEGRKSQAGSGRLILPVAGLEEEIT